MVGEQRSFTPPSNSASGGVKGRRVVLIGPYNGRLDRVVPVGGWYVAGLLAAGTGALVSEGEFRLAVVICLGAAILAAYGRRVPTATIVVPVLMVGALVLAYGFSNTAAFAIGGVGIPISTLLLVACVPAIVRGRPYGGVPTRALL